MRYFAYGSNLCIRRLRNRVSSAKRVGRFQLVGHELRFHKRSTDGSAKADAFSTGNPKDIVWGVVFEILDSQKPTLDDAEGLGRGYDEKVVLVVSDEGQEEKARLYVANLDWVDESLSPYSWYVRFIVDGARQNGLPSEYISRFIESVKPIRDPDGKRDSEKSAIQC